MVAQQKSLLLLEKQGAFAVRPTDIPKPGPGELLVEIHATALNPVDWKIQVYGIFLENFPAVLGTDSSGIVKEVGEGVTEFAVGDKVYAVLLHHSLYFSIDVSASVFIRGSSTTAGPLSSNTQSFLLRSRQNFLPI